MFSHLYCKILRKSQALVLYSVYSYLTITSGRILEHECNNSQGLREREKEYIVRREHNRKRRDLREKGSRLSARIFLEGLELHNRLQWNCVTLSRYNINTVPVDVASSLEVNRVKSVSGATVHVIVLYLLSTIYYMSLANS